MQQYVMTPSQRSGNPPGKLRVEVEEEGVKILELKQKRVDRMYHFQTGVCC